MAKGKPEFEIELCKGCSLCVGACPQGIIRMSEGYNSGGHQYAECVDIAKCTGCTFCATMCPDLVIEVWKYSETPQEMAV